MKILILSAAYFPIISGGVRHVQSLSQELAKRGHQVDVCTIGQRDSPKYHEEEGLKIYAFEGFFQKVPLVFKDPALKFHPPAQDPLITKELRRVIEEEKPDILHAHGWIVYSVLPLKKELKIPMVVTLHDYGFICPTRILMNKNVVCDKYVSSSCIVCGKSLYGFIKSLAAYYGVKRNKSKLESVDKFIAVSSFVKEAHSKALRLSDEDIAMIPNFYAAEADAEEEKAVNLPEDFILFVGFITPFKGVNVLIEAYQKLDTETKLVLIGAKDPDYHYKSTENILVIENAPHSVVMQAMSTCKFAVFPSIWPDPAPTVAFEAMSQKRTVIASDIGGLKDIVVQGETGILVPANNPDKLGEAMDYLLERSETASEMGERGYDRYMKTYTSDVVVPMIINIYENLIRSRGA